MRLLRIGCAALLLAGAVTTVPTAFRGTRAAAAAPPVYYLSLGDSLAASYMPGRGETDQGYAEDTFARLKAATPQLQLKKLGCPGETTTSLLNGGICQGRYPQGSQLATAEAFLKSHRVTYLSLDIGANDVDACTQGGSLDLGCLRDALATSVTNLSTILTRLRAAAPTVRAVGLTYYDPFLAYALKGGAGGAFARQSLTLQQTLNLVQTGLYGAAGFRIADVASAFGSTITSPTPVAGHGEQPADVATVCRLTFMCAQGDVHPNAAGYARIAGAVVAELS